MPKRHKSVFSWVTAVDPGVQESQQFACGRDQNIITLPFNSAVAENLENGAAICCIFSSLTVHIIMVNKLTPAVFDPLYQHLTLIVLSSKEQQENTIIHGQMLYCCSVKVQVNNSLKVALIWVGTVVIIYNLSIKINIIKVCLFFISATFILTRDLKHSCYLRYHLCQPGTRHLYQKVFICLSVASALERLYRFRRNFH